VSPLAPLLFALVGLAAYGWDWAGDPARSSFVLAAVLCGVALAALGLRRGPDGRRCAALMWVCLCGAALQALTAACGIAFEALRSQQAGVCDEGTGRPVRAAVGVLLILVAAYVLRVSGDGSGRR
jgi:hypothetical protein